MRPIFTKFNKPDFKWDSEMGGKSTKGFFLNSLGIIVGFDYFPTFILSTENL